MVRKARAANGAAAPSGVRKKAAKDPNAPKRALSAYLIFSNERRDKLKDEQPNLKFGEVGKVLGEQWRQMSDEQRIPYNRRAEEAKKVYEKAIAEYRTRQSAAVEATRA